MPGFFDALEKFKGKADKKHFVDIDGQNIEVTLKQKLEIQQSGEDNYFCQKGPNGIIVCKKPLVPREQKQKQLKRSEEGIELLDKNPFWPTQQGKRGYKWETK